MLGKFLRGRRKAAGLSQPKLAALTGIPQTYISRIERGEVDLPQRATRDKFHAVLGTTEREWLDAAGEFGTEELPDDIMPPRPAPSPPEVDRAFDVSQIIAFVEAKPDPEFQAKMARQKERRKDKPGSYAGLCLRVYKAWTSNGDAIVGEAEAVQSGM